MQSALRSLIGARFLVILAHFVVVITMFWSINENVLSCIPSDYTTSEYDKARAFLITLLSLTVALFTIEIASFVFGLSMFNVSQTLISIFAHFSGSITLSFFIVDQWACSTYWYIFWFCSALPTFTELCVLLHVLCT